MQIPLKHCVRYNKMMVSLSVLTSVAVLACICFGYIALPFAAGMYATLLIYDSKKIISAALPIAFFVLNVFLSGIFSLEAVAYVIIGLMISSMYKRGVSKAEAAFWVSLTTVLLFVCSLILFAFNSMGKTELSAIKEFYIGLYNESKTVFIDFIVSVGDSLESGHSLAYNVYEAELVFNQLMFAIIPMTMVFAFAIAGISLKILSCEIRKYSGVESGIDLWSFRTPNLVAWFYVAISVMCLFATPDGSVFAGTITVLNTLFSVVFAYLGVSFVYSLMRYTGKGTVFSTAVLVIAFLLLSSFAVQILSYIGVFINVITNKALRKSK